MAAAKEWSKTPKNELYFDVYRTVVLGHYIQYWGMPEYRKTVSRDNDNSYFEIYSFPSSKNKNAYHFATVGLAEQLKPDGEKEGHEYFIVLDSELGGADLDQIFDYVTDLCAHSVKNLVRADPPRVMGPSFLAPAAWATKALLIDEPRGEDEKFSPINIGGELEVELLWLIPIHESEYEFILKEGIDAFDELQNRSQYSIVDVNRESFYPPNVK